MPSENEAADDPCQVSRSIVESACEAVIFADRDGAVRLWNHGAELIFGYAAAEMLGGSLDRIIPERLQRAHGDGFRAAVDSGRTRHTDRVLTTRSIHKNGSKLYVDLSFGLVRDEAGAVLGAYAIGRDSTARHLAEVALKARVAELEGRLDARSGAGADAAAQPASTG